MGIEENDRMLMEMKRYFSQFNKISTPHLTSINKLETQLGKISAHLNVRQKGGLLSDMVDNSKCDTHIMAIVP